MAAPASAHAALVSVSPRPGSTITAAPARVVLTFDENVQAHSTMVVEGPSGRVDHAGTTVLDNHVEVRVRISPRPTDVGAYKVAWRVISADGHPVTGASTFRYQPPGVEAAPATSGSRSDAASDQGARGSTHLWWIIGAVVLVMVAGAALLMPRRRRTGT